MALGYIICTYVYMGGCQNYGPFLGTLNIRGRIIIGTQKGTIILTTTHIYIYIYIHIYADNTYKQTMRDHVGNAPGLIW